MNLYEFEGKNILSLNGITIPASQLISKEDSDKTVKLQGDLVVKSQVLTGKRFKRGLVAIVSGAEQAEAKVGEYLGQVVDGEEIDKVLVEEKLTGKEHFLSITYDTSTRKPVIIYAPHGGVEVENQTQVEKIAVDLTEPVAIKFNNPKLTAIAEKLWKLFIELDFRQVEINPLVETEDGELVAADAKLILDDDGLYRHEELKFPPRQLIGHKKTEREIEANKIDEIDYRGSAGSVYYDLDGDIAVLASGGGASVVVMDALLALGGQPANYTEYSGNPPKEKVEKLTKIALSKPGLNGCWVVGGTANFTDIYETLSGFLEGLRTIQPVPKYPIVIRRGGPRDEEAFTLLKEAAGKEGWDFHIYGSETPMTETAETIVSLVNEFKEK